jgi:hypothetical protein
LKGFLPRLKISQRRTAYAHTSVRSLTTEDNDDGHAATHSQISGASQYKGRARKGSKH